MAEETEENPKDVDVANSSFYANNFVFQVVGNEVYIDFQRLSPRYDSNSPTNVYSVKEHSTIITNVSLFKDMVILASQQLRALEEKFGEITPPEFIKNLSKEQQKTIEEAKKLQEEGNPNEKPSYYG